MEVISLPQQLNDVCVKPGERLFDDGSMGTLIMGGVRHANSKFDLHKNK